jgi:hypothetical protein
VENVRVSSIAQKQSPYQETRLKDSPLHVLLALVCQFFRCQLLRGGYAIVIGSIKCIEKGI